MFGDSTLIFMQLANQLRTEIVAGTYPDDAKAPSINELAVFHRINPAIANRVVTLLVEQGVLIKRRGIGMFVTDDARLCLIKERRQVLVDRYVHPLIAEAAALDISGQELVALIRKKANP